MNTQHPKLSVCVPAYNEEKTIEQVIRNLLALEYDGQPLVYEIIVGDDGSKDATLSIVEKLTKEDQRVSLVKHPVNLGKTQNVRACILKSKGDVVVIQDADLELDQRDILKLYKVYLEDQDCIVYGNRFHSETTNHGPNYLGNLFVTAMSNLFTGMRKFKVEDMETNYKMAQGDLFRDIAQTIESKSCFGFEPEVTAKFARTGKAVKNVDIKYDPRTVDEGKHMNAIRDGMKAFFEILKFNLFARGYRGYGVIDNPDAARLLIATHRSYPATGGLERHVYKLAEKIAEDNDYFEVVNLSCSQGPTVRERYGSRFVITKIKSFFIIGNAYPLPTPLQAWRYYHEISRFSPDVIHTHGRHFVTTWIAITWGFLHRKEIIHTEHGGEIFFENKYIAAMIKAIDWTFIRLMLARAKKVTAVSEYVAEYLHYDLKVKRIQLIHNFIDPEELSVDSKPENGELKKVFTDKRKLVTFPYRLVDSKGYKLFVQLAEKYEDNDEYLFVMAGDGPGEEHVFEAANRLGNLTFLGTLSHKDSLVLIKNSDLVTNFSAQEGLPTTLMEAMWFKRKLLITDIGPNVEVTASYGGKVIVKRNIDDISKNFEKSLVEIDESGLDIPPGVLLSTAEEDYRTLYLKEELSSYVQFPHTKHI